MSSEFGNHLRVNIFGESHGSSVGVTVQGLPSGEIIDLQELNEFMGRRAPGRSDITTSRKESDIPEFVSGINGCVLTGYPLTALIRNSDQHSSDYSSVADKPRPSHADYTAKLRYGEAVDLRGGGHFSGRLTAPLCIAGGIAKQLLQNRGISIGAHLFSVGTVTDLPFPLHPSEDLLTSLAKKALPVLDDDSLYAMKEEIRQASQNGDSVGGIVEACVISFPGGLGDPIFDGLESQLAKVLFGIPGVKGVSFGSGFSAAYQNGSIHNDPFCIRNGKIETETNNSGGIQGGISNGMPILIPVAFKPTASISIPQKTVSLSKMEETEIVIKGRHDPCIAVRAVPVVEAA
ncbi:MAG: chorismate synthase, partial [Oscillospiraceae bacterium]|nr:chorismate synthase [Oscillospiraceae bacterium]